MEDGVDKGDGSAMARGKRAAMKKAATADCSGFSGKAPVAHEAAETAL
jgi:hypothetical protein